MDGCGDGPAASIVLVTRDRLNMLRECVASVLDNTEDVDYELIVWDNASTDGTSEYIDRVAAAHPHVRVFHSPRNIGLNGVAASVRMARGRYIVEMDDDVVEVPRAWLRELIRSFEVIPRAGYLAADVVQNEVTNGAKPSAENYLQVDFGQGVAVDVGPVGGWCSITSADVVADIGNFMEAPERVFFGEDNEFAGRCTLAGYRVGIVCSVRVMHATGPVANRAYGCIEVCKLKYSDDPSLAPLLRSTLDVEAEGECGLRTAVKPCDPGDGAPSVPAEGIERASLNVHWTPPLDEQAMERALHLADGWRGAIRAELLLKQRFYASDYRDARRLLWRARSRNPSTVRRCLMLAVGLVSPRMLARRWRRLAGIG